MLTIKNHNSNILTDISFHLKQHENLIILGSNGAGKSTLAKVLCGITPSNNVTINGKKITQLKTKERTKLINYIPAKLEIFDEYLTLEQYLDLSRLHTLLASKNILKLLELEHLKTKPCQQLSSGEQQLTMLASAVLHNARITIFDEPTANLDPKKSRDVYALLKSKLFQSKIIITHDLNLAYRLGYKILYIKDGKISFFDTSERFFHPSNLDHFFASSVQKVDEYIMVNL
ncbi:ATP-binding cassette domain-containing protein [bacterium]|nr:ATP-binding cassette domain-containing protein [bacterium]MBU1958347.1 ATP-binding cassette domain-containing protein [bacterium]